MTQQHPITPPPELVREWYQEANLSGSPYEDRFPNIAYELHIATRAAQWGADQELEACLRLVEIDAGEDAYDFARYIRAARRPKPPSLKEQALDVLQRYTSGKTVLMDSGIDTIRRALEQLDD
jgi:hypothetical protein